MGHLEQRTSAGRTQGARFFRFIARLGAPLARRATQPAFCGQCKNPEVIHMPIVPAPPVSRVQSCPSSGLAEKGRVMSKAENGIPR